MTNQPSDDSNKRRDDLRRIALKSGRIISKEKGTVINCRIRNISEKGARLELGLPQLLPHTFELHVTDLPPRRCNLRWARGTLVGVEFQD